MAHKLTNRLEIFEQDMKKSVLIGFIAAVLVSAGARAEQRVYSLKDCMRYAVDNSTDMKVQAANMDDDRIARRDAILAAFTPSVSGAAHAYSNFGRAIDPETNTYVSIASFNNAYSVSAGIDLFNGFSAVNNLKITKMARDMGFSERQQTEDKICLATMEAYYNVVYYTQLAKILESQVQTASDALHLAKRQEELGQKGYADVVQMEADLADREYQRQTAENSLLDAYITLKDIMFWPIDEELLIDDSFAEDTVEVDLSDSSDATAEITEQAKQWLPEAFIAKGNMDNALRELRTAKWQLAPSLHLYAGWSSSYYTYPGQPDYVTTPFWKQISGNSGEYVQLTLSIPVFDRLSRYSTIARKKNEWKRYEAEYDHTMRNVEAEVKRAVQDRNGASAAYVQAERRAAVQEEAFRLNAKKFEQGLISSIEYKTASNDYLNAKAERLNALLKYYLKKRVVTYYSGIPYMNQE